MNQIHEGKEAEILLHVLLLCLNFLLVWFQEKLYLLVTKPNCSSNQKKLGKLEIILLSLTSSSFDLVVVIITVLDEDEDCSVMDAF